MALFVFILFILLNQIKVPLGENAKTLSLKIKKGQNQIPQHNFFLSIVISNVEKNF